MAVRYAYLLQQLREQRAALRMRLRAKAREDNDPDIVEQWERESFTRPDTA